METLWMIWLFFQDQILGMKWLNTLIGNALNAVGLTEGSMVSGVLQFFIYDTIKIFIPAVGPDLWHLLYPELLPAGTDQKDSRPLPRNRCQYSRGTAGDGYAILFLLFHPNFYGIYQRRSAGRG